MAGAGRDKVMVAGNRHEQGDGEGKRAGIRDNKTGYSRGRGQQGVKGHSLAMVIVTQMDARLINFFSAMIWTIISLNAGNGYWSSFAGGQMGHNGVH